MQVVSWSARLSYDPWQNADDKTSFPEVVPTPERADQFADQLSIAATTVNASELDAATDVTGEADVAALNRAKYAHSDLLAKYGDRDAWRTLMPQTSLAHHRIRRSLRAHFCLQGWIMLICTVS
jgi:hypothetical protein